MAKIICKCPLVRHENNCEDCIYNPRYHYFAGECVRNKTNKPSTETE